MLMGTNQVFGSGFGHGCNIGGGFGGGFGGNIGGFRPGFGSNNIFGCGLGGNFGYNNFRLSDYTIASIRGNQLSYQLNAATNYLGFASQFGNMGCCFGSPFGWY